MTDDEAEILKATKQILRVAERSASTSSEPHHLGYSAAEIQVEKDPTVLNARIGSRVVGDVLSKTVFGIGMFFVSIFTGGIAAFLPDRDGKVMFAGFAVVCLLVAVYHIDATSRWIRTSIKKNDSTEQQGSKQ